MGILLAILASTMLNVGKGVQKWKVHVLGRGRAVLAAEHRGDFGIWLVGFALTAGASIFFSLALKFTDKPSTVSALNGVGLIGLVVFARLCLKETVGPRELLGALMIVVGTGVVGAFDVPLDGAQQPSVGPFFICVGVMVAVFVPLCLFSWWLRRFHGLVFGSAAGCLVGVAMVLADVALAMADDDFFGQLLGPYVYVAMVVSLGALAMTQLAFWRAPAMVVVPTLNSLVILAPLLIQYVTFGTVLEGAQYLGIGIIVPGAVLATLGRST